MSFKTLVTVGKSKNYYVFVIPVDKELDMKKAASAVGEKNVEMIHVKDINAVTGYIRGGCTPIGMKKQYKTVVNDTVKNLINQFINSSYDEYSIKLLFSSYLYTYFVFHQLMLYK